MKKAIVISTLIATTLLNSGNSNAAASKEENIGVASGALTGAAVAGPVGFVIGSAIGAIIGNEVEKAGQLEEVQNKLVASSERENQLKREIAMIQENMEFTVTDNNTGTDTQWMTEGLTLNLMFTTGSSDLSDNDHSNIQRVSTVLNRFPQLNLKLDGYTDPRGSESANLTLSQNRVNTVKAAFELLNIDSSRIISEAHGESEGFNIEGLTKENKGDAFALARKVSVSFVADSTGQVAQN